MCVCMCLPIGVSAYLCAYVCAYVQVVRKFVESLQINFFGLTEFNFVQFMS
jgi:hypothetical protein